MTRANIKTYSACNARLRDSTPERAAMLLTLGLVCASRNRYGRINSIQFLGAAGSRSIAKTAHMGQTYSVRLPVLGRRLVWAHKDLVGLRGIEALFGELTHDELEQRDLFVRAIFRAVPLSVMGSSTERATPAAAPAPAAAKVVSIDALRTRNTRRARSARRPLEFDSELRAA